MHEMDSNSDTYSIQEDRSETPVQGPSIHGSARDAIHSALGEHEDDKERTIAKAALSIAELGAVFSASLRWLFP